MSMTILGGGDSFCPPFLVRGWDELVCDLLLIFEPHCRRKLIDESLVLGWLISLKDSVHAALIRGAATRTIIGSRASHNLAKKTV
ncbi:hypothetical protein ACFX1R_011997 [Malus domestica]